MNHLNQENQNMSEALAKFSERMQDVIENINSIEEKNKEIQRLQQRVKCGANQKQNSKDKITLNQLRELHLKAGNEVHKVLKEEQDKLNVEELVADREQRELLDEHNETYIKRKQIMDHYKRFLDLWSTFHRQQVEYRDSMKTLLKTRYKVINENATDEDVENLLDPSKEIYTNSILQDSKRKKSEAIELQNRWSELKQLETFIGETHNLLMHLEELMSDEEERNSEQSIVDETRHTDSFWRKTGPYIIILCFIVVTVTLMILSVAGVFSPSPPTKQTTTAKTTPVIETTTFKFIEPDIEKPLE